MDAFSNSAPTLVPRDGEYVEHEGEVFVARAARWETHTEFGTGRRTLHAIVPLGRPQSD